MIEVRCPKCRKQFRTEMPAAEQNYIVKCPWCGINCRTSPVSEQLTYSNFESRFKSFFKKINHKNMLICLLAAVVIFCICIAACHKKTSHTADISATAPAITSAPSPTAKPTPEPTPEIKEINGYSLKYGELLSVITNGGVDGNTLVIKAKIQPSYSNEATINQNYFNIEDLVKTQGADKYSAIDYWAVADMQDGSESKVVAFVANSEMLNAIKNGNLAPIKYGEFVQDLFVHPRLR